MTNHDFVDLSAQDLRLVLASGRIDPEQFGIFGQGELCVGDLTVTATVIGASHCLNVGRGGKEEGFTEMFACVAFESGLPAVTVEPWKNPLTVLKNDRGDVTYLAFARLAKFGRDSGAKRIIREANCTGKHRNRIGLVCRFPAGPDGLSPRTAVSVRMFPKDGWLRTETVHEYPNERVTAITYSELRVPGPY